MLRTIIIDDEKEGAELLGYMLAELQNEVKVVGTSYSALEGIKLINEKQPDLVFLDVQMPNVSGLDLIKAFPDHKFDVVFCTAHEKYAIEAIKEGALDYLLKPIDENDLENVVKKALARKEKQNGSRFKEKISLPTRDGLLYFNINDITDVEADGSYCIFKFANGTKHMVAKNLKEFEGLLNREQYFRSHRSHIINLKYVKAYSHEDGGIIHMQGDYKVKLSRTKKEEFLKRMSSL